MNSNWSHLKRKLDENKEQEERQRKRRRRFDKRDLIDNSNIEQIERNNKSDSNRNNNKNNKSSLHRYAASSNNKLNEKIENYIKSKSQKEIFECIDLIPPQTLSRNNEKRKEFWNNLRLQLRARLPKQFLYKIITPLQDNQKLHTMDRSKATNVMAMDCEMVGIGHEGKKSILARISIVNYDGDVVYDQFVKPTGYVTDYRYNITGITQSDLNKHGISFNQCQTEVIKLLNGKKLIGHSIENDFKVLKCKKVLKENYFQSKTEKIKKNEKNWSKRKQKRKLNSMNNNFYKNRNDSSWVFDTAKCELFNDDIERPRSLKFLLELFLGIHIQSSAHDSVIDAISTMALYRCCKKEIYKHSNEKQEKKVQINKGKQDYTKRKMEFKQKRIVQRKNNQMFRNYAYSNDNTINELDRLIQQHSQFEDAENANNEKSGTTETVENPFTEEL